MESQKAGTKLTKPKFIKVNDIKPGVHGFNIYLKVISIEQKQDLIRSNGESIAQIIALCGDETGVVRIRVLGDNTKLIEFDKVISIRNGKSEVFQEKIRLEVDRWGKINVEPDVSISEPSLKNNISEVAYVSKLVQVSKEKKN